MGTPFPLHRYSFQDYLALEEVSTVKHEFLDGEIYAMAGGSVLHAALSAAIVAQLHVQLGADCRVYSSDLRIRVLETGLASYADAAVVCGRIETDPGNADTVTNPIALVEVLSPSTIDYDLGEKYEQYTKAPSVCVLIYVWQDRRQLEIRERTASGWRSQIFGPGQTASIDVLECRVDVDSLYRAAGGP